MFRPLGIHKDKTEETNWFELTLSQIFLSLAFGGSVDGGRWS